MPVSKQHNGGGEQRTARPKRLRRKRKIFDPGEEEEVKRSISSRADLVSRTHTLKELLTILAKNDNAADLAQLFGHPWDRRCPLEILFESGQKLSLYADPQDKYHTSIFCGKDQAVAGAKLRAQNWIYLIGLASIPTNLRNSRKREQAKSTKLAPEEKKTTCLELRLAALDRDSSLEAPRLLDSHYPFDLIKFSKPFHGNKAPISAQNCLQLCLMLACQYNYLLNSRMIGWPSAVNQALPKMRLFADAHHTYKNHEIFLRLLRVLCKPKQAYYSWYHNLGFELQPMSEIEVKPQPKAPAYTLTQVRADYQQACNALRSMTLKSLSESLPKKNFSALQSLWHKLERSRNKKYETLHTLCAAIEQMRQRKIKSAQDNLYKVYQLLFSWVPWATPCPTHTGSQSEPPQTIKFWRPNSDVEWKEIQTYISNNKLPEQAKAFIENVCIIGRHTVAERPAYTQAEIKALAQAMLEKVTPSDKRANRSKRHRVMLTGFTTKRTINRKQGGHLLKRGGTPVPVGATKAKRREDRGARKNAPNR